jgi:hypothetical protein
MNPLVSIIIRTWHQEAHLSGTLNALAELVAGPSGQRISHRDSRRFSLLGDSLKMLREVWPARQNGRPGIYDLPRSAQSIQAGG